jgi:hypothetical protein
MSLKVILALVVGLATLTVAGLWVREHVTVRIQVDDEVAVSLRGALPFRANIEQPIEVAIDKELTANVKLGSFPIALDESIEVPLNMKLQVPVDSDVRIDQPLDLALMVPIDTVLTERELDLSQLSVPIDTDIFIDDVIDLDFVLPIDTDVTTTLGMRVPVKARIPIKLKVPVHQKVHVRDTLKLSVKKLHVPLKMTIPVQVHVPLNQTFRVRGMIEAPIKHTVTVPIHKIMHPNLGLEMPVTVQLTGKVPAQLKASLDASVSINDKVQTRLGDIMIRAKDVALELK